MSVFTVHLITHLLGIYYSFIVHVVRMFLVCFSWLYMYYHYLDEENRRDSQGVISGLSNLVMVLLLRSWGKTMPGASKKNPFAYSWKDKTERRTNREIHGRDRETDIDRQAGRRTAVGFPSSKACNLHLPYALRTRDSMSHYLHRSVSLSVRWSCFTFGEFSSQIVRI